MSPREKEQSPLCPLPFEAALCDTGAWPAFDNSSPVDDDLCRSRNPESSPLPKTASGFQCSLSRPAASVRLCSPAQWAWEAWAVAHLAAEMAALQPFLFLDLD